MIRRSNIDEQRSAGRRGTIAGISMAELMVVLSIAGLVWGLLFVATFDSRRSPVERNCLAKMHGIRLALLSYQEAYHSLPPAYVCDRSGKPAHSWRVLILPFLGRLDLYQKYRFGEPWNSAHNIELARDIPKEFQCQSDTPHSPMDTSYLAVTGAGTLWPGAIGTGVAKDDQRLAVVEVVGSGIVWTEPRDLPVEALTARRAESSPQLAHHRDDGPSLASLHQVIELDRSRETDNFDLSVLAVDSGAFARFKAVQTR